MLRCLALIAAVTVHGAGLAAAQNYPGSGSNVYGPRNGTGTNFYQAPPSGSLDPWNQPRRPTLEHRWQQPQGVTDPWNQPRKPDLNPWGKPKY